MSLRHDSSRACKCLTNAWTAANHRQKQPAGPRSPTRSSVSSYLVASAVVRIAVATAHGVRVRAFASAEGMSQAARSDQQGNATEVVQKLGHSQNFRRLTVLPFCRFRWGPSRRMCSPQASFPGAQRAVDFYVAIACSRWPSSNGLLERVVSVTISLLSSALLHQQPFPIAAN